MSLGRLVSTNPVLRHTTRNTARFHPNLRLFAVPHAHTLKPRSNVTVGMGPSRSLSFWRSAPASTPTPTPPPIPATPEVSGSDSQLDVFAATSPEPTNIPEVVTSLDIPSTLEILPLNYGDLASLGFSQWTPVGIAQWSMELVQVASGMPWFWTIVTVTVLSRLIVLPFNIISLRTAAKLAPYQPRLMQLREELQKTGGPTKDPIGIQKISLQQKKIYQDAGVSMMGPLLTPLVQAPVSLGMFLGVKRLCDFPLEQLKVGGLGWITDLTVPDPTYLLPLAVFALINVQISVTAKDITAGAAGTLHLFNFIKAVAFVSVPFMASLPAGVVVHVLTGVFAFATQSLILRAPSIRTALDIPKIPDHLRIKPPTFLESVKFGVDWFKNKSAEAKAQARAQQRKKF